MVKTRSARLLDEMPKNGNKILPSAIKAGYTESYARARGKNILRVAIKEQAREILDASQNKETSLKDIKRYMSDIIGISPKKMFKRLEWLALENDKDAGTALKILAPLVREHGVILSTDEDQAKVVVPVINLGFAQSNPENMAKNIEPILEHETLNLPSIKDGSVEP